MSILTDKSQLIQYLKENNLWAKKGLSQNFLIDKDALDKIVEVAEIKDSDLIIEVGPGVGTLTSELVRRAGEVVSVELDNKLAELLNCRIVELSGSPSNTAIQSPPLAGSRQNAGQYSNGRIQVINSDILKLNLNEVIGAKPYKVVANIPYHITSKILELFLSREHKPELMVLLVQKEVAERVCAKAGSMSILSVSVQLYGQPEIVGIVPKESFFPSPKVDSAILKIVIARSGATKQSVEDRHASLAMTREQEKDFFRCVHIGFAARRKTLLNNLMVGYGFPREKVIDILKEVGLKETVRAQELSIEEWKKLVRLINC